MSNLQNTPRLFVVKIDKNDLNEKSLQPLFEQDNDFSENVEYYRNDTLELGFENEAERVSKEIYEKCFAAIEDKTDENAILSEMLNEVFEVERFIGRSNEYGKYKSELIETDYEYIFVIATIM
jgi:hypothetical protein